jgi:hypothetical protein
MQIKKYFYFVSLLLTTIMMFSCTSSSELSGIWVNKEKMQNKSYKKIYVVAETADIQARKAIEGALAAKAEEKGFEVISSIDALPPSLSDVSFPDKEILIKSVKASGCDAAFVVTLLRKEESVRYTPGTTAYTPLPYYSWNGSFVNYYDYWRPSVTTPGYYTNNQNYFLQSNLYDTQTDELMISIQSELFNPTSLNKFSKDFVDDLVSKMKKEGLLKK